MGYATTKSYIIYFLNYLPTEISNRYANKRKNKKIKTYINLDNKISSAHTFQSAIAEIVIEIVSVTDRDRGMQLKYSSTSYEY